MRILLVEDDENLAEALEKTLTQQNFLVDYANDGQAGWELAAAFDYDLIILDLHLPKLNGIQFCQQLRSVRNCSPVLLLTAYDTRKSRVQGLNSGADDYLAKPFDLDELLARIRSLLRRSSANPLPLLEWGKLTLDRNLHEVNYNGQPLQLTPKEYGLLELFLSQKNRILDYNFLVDRLWKSEAIPTENVIRAHIKRLRNKLRQAGAEDVIETVYGLGYRLAPAPQEELQAATPTTITVNQGLGALWQRYQQRYLDRLETLDEMIRALAAGTLDQSLYQQARQQIHTLIGSVGSFGLERASQLGRSIEQILLTLNLNQPAVSQIEQLRQLLAALRQELEQSPTQSLEPEQVIIASPAPERHLLIIEDDADFAELLAVEARTQGFQVRIAATVSQARAALSEAHPPNLVLLDLYLPDTPTQGYVLLAELSAANPTIPVIVLTAQETFADRVQVARLGGVGFLAKPVSPTQVLQAIHQVLQQSQSPDANILIVDDDPQLLDRLQRLLKPWGFHLTLLDNPQQFWHTLEQVKPDLLILNIEMPEMTGIDLCQVVRNDLRWQHLPIIFLSAHRDGAMIERIFAAGADDFVPKPISGSELVTRILNRLRRYPLQRSSSHP